ncbi:Glycosyltransferase [Ignavibacterium album JCM 16511]|uniref:Glycosyltransferase n=1 Tax=Ignavibacterium album (strain DSM 19864 / JCM 16511 / NBRC 101810 / Mat9-16) TaxID=945713 RepID=I0AJG5_IGNAJ|nr:glycosyltransferase family 2 protein [Ignavibacterium album]AFH49122.1 Glycosyltransferase [Ignavibacterium album JCM 16511]
MCDLTVIILTYNEEIHIKRCIESVRDIAKDIFIVDCFSTDKTIEIAESLGAKVFQNKWEGNQAKQFNWALDHLELKSDWVLWLAADEYLLPELKNEILLKIEMLPKNATGITLNRRIIFLNKWIKNGIYPSKILRLFRYKKARCEQRWMDEHIVIFQGETVEFENDFVDHNLNNLSWWITKHNGYAIREAIDLLDIELGLIGNKNNNVKLSPQAESKRKKKIKYANQPLFVRSFLYFLYRYIFKLGFLEGKEGFLWHFLQGWWYRTLVDAIIFEIKMKCGNDKEKIKNYILKEYGIDVSK